MGTTVDWPDLHKPVVGAIIRWGHCTLTGSCWWGQTLKRALCLPSSLEGLPGLLTAQQDIAANGRPPDGCSKLWLCFPAARCRPDHYSAEVAACLCRSLEPHFSPDCLQLPEDLELTESAQCAAERARLESQAAEFRNVLEIIETIGDGPAN